MNVHEPADGPSPAKKRKLMSEAIGFQASKRNATKAQTRRFASAFDDPKRSKLSSKPGYSHLLAPQAQATPVSAIQPRAASHKDSLRPLRPPDISTPDIPQAGPSTGSSSRSSSRNGIASRLNPPSFISALRSATKFTLTSATLSSIKSSSRSPTKPVSKASIQTFQPALPEPVKLARNIHELRPPPPPPPPSKKGRPTLDASTLKTISTTHVAVTLDPRTESGAEELMALQLERNAQTYVPPAERELNRGLGQSPEKASKSKSHKFVRGGLADRAHRLFTRQNTSTSLWYTEVKLQSQRPEVHKPVAPHLCLRIVEVLHVASIASLQRSNTVPRLCIVRCAKLIGGRATGDLNVLLDFGSPGSAAEKAHTLDEVRVGKEVHLWRPWGSTQLDAEEMQQHGAQPRDGSTLFCTRFRIT